MLTRAIVGSSIGLSLLDHEGLDTLVHKSAEDSYTELLYTGKDLTSVNVWTDVGKTLKIRDVSLSYTGKNLTGVVVQQYDGAGAVVATLTKTLAYTGKDLTSVAAVRT